MEGKEITAKDELELHLECFIGSGEYCFFYVKPENALIAMDSYHKKKSEQLQSELEKAKELIKMAQNLTAGTSKESFERFDKFMKQSTTFLEGSGNKTK